MTNSPTTSTTSIKHQPLLRWSLVGVWILVVVYTITVYVQSIPLFFSSIPTGEGDVPLGNLDSVLFSLFDLGIDFLMIAGFSLIAYGLFFRRSDDWFAIFTSGFMITFAGRVSNAINGTAMLPGFESKAGLLIALGDIGVVLFILLFPNGKFSPGWMKYLVPPLVISMLGLYVFPNTPFHWQKIGLIPYLLVTVSWYVFSLVVFARRYFRNAGIKQKQQMRWVMIGTMGPFVWYILFNISQIALADLLSESWVASTIHLVLARTSSLFLFLMLPLFVAVAISRSKLFDIDLIINRSLVYGGLTTGLVLTFAIVLGVFSFTFRTIHPGDQSMLAVTVSAVGAGALFQPARKRLQRFVDKTFYHIQIDYEKTIAGLPVSKDTSETDITFSNYKNLQLIGRGGMSNVYRAENPTTGQTVAIKVLSSNLSEDEQFRRRFMREAETVSSLSHNNIVRVVNYGEEKGTYFIVMEFLTGPDLRNLLKAQERLGLDESLPLLQNVASALDYAHQRGLVHRDIKPSNVMLDSTTQPARAVLTDFGIAKIADANTRITASGVLGTFDYIAHEQIQSSAEVDGRADIYALGVMTYQMLTGHMPSERSNTGALLLAHLNSPPPDARETLPDLPRQTARAIQRAMGKKPAERFETASEFVAALESTNSVDHENVVTISVV